MPVWSAQAALHGFARWLSFAGALLTIGTVISSSTVLAALITIAVTFAVFLPASPARTLPPA